MRQQKYEIKKSISKQQQQIRYGNFIQITGKTGNEYNKFPQTAKQNRLIYF